uniref:Uncharacterized protein n=1 Tax=Esox lucius TaxID=8010 RepID=A0AAY5L9S8_ESOLU
MIIIIIIMCGPKNNRAIYLSIYLSMQVGVVGVAPGRGAPIAMNQLWGGPACKRLRTPVLYSLSARLLFSSVFLFCLDFLFFEWTS